MNISLDAGAIVLAIWTSVIAIGFALKSLQAQLKKTGEQLDRLIIASERAQSREEAKAQFAVASMHTKIDG